MSYKIYRNLHNGKLSIKSRKTGLVVGHCDAINLFKAKFKVSEAGVMKIREKKQKAVVATVDGGITWMKGFVSYKGRNVQTVCGDLVGGVWLQATFNPYKYTSFVNRQTEAPVMDAEIVVIANSGLIQYK